MSSYSAHHFTCFSQTSDWTGTRGQVPRPAPANALSGVKEKEFEKMAKLSLEDGNAGSNPIQGKEQDIINIFKAAY